MKIKIAHIRFYGELNFFLRCQNEIISVDFKGRQSAKHIIESLGVPHTEVERILVNKRPQEISYILDDSDFVDVFPWESGAGLPSHLQINPRFILDNHLGKLAVYLRILGIDTLYHNDFQDDEIVEKIINDERILLTRDRRLLMRREVLFGYCVRHDKPKDQLIEVLDRFNLKDMIKPLNRCLKCNHELEPIDKSSIIHRLEPLTKLYYQEFHLCPRCDKLYWKGSHYDHMLAFINRISEKDR